jgi:hypothetical protein
MTLTGRVNLGRFWCGKHAYHLLSRDLVNPAPNGRGTHAELLSQWRNHSTENGVIEEQLPYRRCQPPSSQTRVQELPTKTLHSR